MSVRPESASDRPPVSTTAAGPGKVICTLPTYNEAGNVLRLARELLALGPEYEVLVVDDDSPDGTWRLVQEERERAGEPRLHLLHRLEDRGRGRAGRDGFVLALEMGARAVVEMDADYSHHPSYVPAMVAELGGPNGVGLVLGSRGVAGGHDAERTWLRQLVTKAANAYIRLVLGIRVRDCNSGFRAWSRTTLERIRVQDTFSAGPAIVQELLYKTARAQVPIHELPISFRNREEGESTLTLRTLFRGYTTVLKLRWMALRGEL